MCFCAYRISRGRVIEATLASVARCQWCHGSTDIGTPHAQREIQLESSIHIYSRSGCSMCMASGGQCAPLPSQAAWQWGGPISES